MRINKSQIHEKPSIFNDLTNRSSTSVNQKQNACKKQKVQKSSFNKQNQQNQLKAEENMLNSQLMEKSQNLQNSQYIQNLGHMKNSQFVPSLLCIKLRIKIKQFSEEYYIMKYQLSSNLSLNEVQNLLLKEKSLDMFKKMSKIQKYNKKQGKQEGKQKNHNQQQVTLAQKLFFTTNFKIQDKILQKQKSVGQIYQKIQQQNKKFIDLIFSWQQVQPKSQQQARKKAQTVDQKSCCLIM